MKIRRGQLYVAQGRHFKHIIVADLLGDRKAAQSIGRQEFRLWVFRHPKLRIYAAADIDAFVALRTPFIDENFQALLLHLGKGAVVALEPATALLAFFRVRA